MSFRRCRFGSQRGFSLSDGVLASHSLRLPEDSISCMVLHRSPLYALFGAARVSVRDASFSKMKTRFLTLSKRDASRLLRKHMPLGEKESAAAVSAAPREIFFLALSGSDAASGLLLLIPALSKLRRLGVDLLGRLFDKTSSMLSAVPDSAREDMYLSAVSALSAAVTVAALIALGGWAFSVLCISSANARFDAISSGDTLIIRRGMLSRKAVYIPKSHVCGTVTRRTLLLLLLGRASVDVLSDGCPETPLIPAAAISEIPKKLARLGFAADEKLLSVEADKGSRAHIFLPRFAAAAAVTLIFLRLSRGNDAERFISLAFIPAVILMIWYALTAFVGSKMSCAALESGCIEITGTRFFTIRTVRISRRSVCEIKIKQSPFQKRKGLCDLYIRPVCGKTGVTCRFLPFDRAVKFARMIR